MQNSKVWNTYEVVNFFDKNRRDVKDVYPSEWLFLANELRVGWHADFLNRLQHLLSVPSGELK